jgi:hypothetical protein
MLVVNLHSFFEDLQEQQAFQEVNGRNGRDGSHTHTLLSFIV